MRAVRDAVQFKIPPILPLAGVSDGGRAENTEGLGHHVGLGPPTVILCRWEVLEKVKSFRYLGRILGQDDNDIRAVRSQIKKA